MIRSRNEGLVQTIVTTHRNECSYNSFTLNPWDAFCILCSLIYSLQFCAFGNMPILTEYITIVMRHTCQSLVRAVIFSVKASVLHFMPLEWNYIYTDNIWVAYDTCIGMTAISGEMISLSYFHMVISSKTHSENSEVLKMDKCCIANIITVRCRCSIHNYISFLLTHLCRALSH